MLAVMLALWTGVGGGAGYVLAKENSIRESGAAAAILPEDILWPDESGKYSYAYKDAQPGNEYVLLAVSGVYHTADEIMQEKLESNLLYIDQKTADETGVSFEGFIPSKTDNCTLFLAGEGKPAVVVGYLSKDLFKIGAYTADENGTEAFSSSWSAVQGTAWADFKATLPLACYAEVCSDYADSLYIPVKLAWRDCAEYDSSVPGKTFEIFADPALKDGYGADGLSAALTRMLEPLKASVTIQAVAAIPESMTAVKTQTVYQKGEKVSDTDIKVQVTYSDGTVHEVSGWTSDIEALSTAEAGTQYLTVTYTEGDVTLQARIAVTILPEGENKDMCQVSFDTQGGSPVSPRSVEKGSRLEALDTPVREGFLFTGWYMDKTCKIPYDLSTVISENITLYAGWKEAGISQTFYTVSFDTGYEKTIAPVTVAAGAYLAEPDTVLDRVGYIFLGWYYEEEQWNFEQNPVENDMTLKARWLRKYGDGSDFYCYAEEEPVCTYTGKPVRPSFALMDQNFRLLQPKKDYTVKYTDNVQVSAENKRAKAIITGKGNYAGTVEIPFTITAKDIADETAVMMKLKGYSAYKKAGCSPAPSGKYGGKTLKQGKDFTVRYQKLDGYGSESGTPVDGSVLSEAGYYQVIVEGKGNFTGSRSFVFQMGAEGLKDLGKASVKFPASASMAYTGENISLAGIALTIGKTELKEGTDYILVLPEDNQSVGKKTAVAKALPESTVCYGEKEINYTVTGLPMKSVKVSLKSKKTDYTGFPVTDNIESVTIKLDQKKSAALKAYYGDAFSGGDTYTLKENTDYTVQYKANKKAGKATARLTGVGLFSGVLESKFTINRTNVNSSKVQISLLNDRVPQKKSGAAVTIQAVHTENGRQTVLQEGADYTLRYTGNKEAGAGAKVTVKGMGNYTGSFAKTFTIESKALDAQDMKIAVVNPAKLTKKAGYVYKPALLVYDGDALLKEGKDFTADYSGCITQADVDEGRTEGQVTVRGKDGGSYSGSWTASYQVLPDSIAGKTCSITIADQIYTGAPVVFDPEDSKDQAAFTATITQADGQSTALVPGKDFEIVSYSKNTACGTAKVVLRGIGAYGGSRTVNFKIVRRRIQ